MSPKSDTRQKKTKTNRNADGVPDSTPTLAEAMKFRREQMEENQREISLRAGMALHRWQRLESGKNAPTIADARKLYAVGIPVSVILGPTQRKFP